jgi:glycosyltransferase involved in cell wall biosynthesis
MITNKQSAQKRKPKRVVFNALSVTNMSGRHVFLGQAREAAAAASGPRQHVLLYHSGNRDLLDSLGSVMECIECPCYTSRWLGRSLWEFFRLPSLLKKLEADALFSPSGMTVPSVTIPQVVMASNPWCLVPDAYSGFAESIKAWLQRFAYRRTQRDATLILYLSDFMKKIYEANAGLKPQGGKVVYLGLENNTFEQSLEPLPFDDRPLEIVTISAMARHKAIEDVVKALAVVRARGADAKLTLVGPWPDVNYRQKIEQTVMDACLSEHVTFVGYAPRHDLFRYYGTAKVFCLLSRCESFGIPAAEAQVFGTPCVVADCCAPPEVVGRGGIAVPVGDIEAAAEALDRLLTDADLWAHYSRCALENVQRFRWEKCSKCFVDWINDDP